MIWVFSSKGYTLGGWIAKDCETENLNSKCDGISNYHLLGGTFYVSFYSY